MQISGVSRGSTGLAANSRTNPPGYEIPLLDNKEHSRLIPGHKIALRDELSNFASEKFSVASAIGKLLEDCDILGLESDGLSQHM